MVWDTQPIEPGPTPWTFPSVDLGDDGGLVGLGGDLEPGTLLAAYRSGLFPMPIGRRKIGWWSPDPRGVLPLDGLTVSRSLRRSCSRFEIRFDTVFREVMRRCGDPRRPHGWINTAFIDAYERMHRLGWAHSVEAFSPDGRLVGGLYGVRINRFFAGESMFHTERDASKVALVALVEQLRSEGTARPDSWEVSMPPPSCEPRSERGVGVRSSERRSGGGWCECSWQRP